MPWERWGSGAFKTMNCVVCIRRRVARPCHIIALSFFSLSCFFHMPFFRPFRGQHAGTKIQANAAKESSAEELISALVGLYKKNAGTLTPDPMYSAFYDSHPPASIRIAHLRRQ